MTIQDKKRANNGSALILVVIVTVMLSIIGVIFVMTMRIREMTTANVTDDRDLEMSVRTVTEKIQTVLLQDLFGTNLNRSIIDGFGGNEASDSHAADSWLASLEPTWFNANGTPTDPTDDWYQWSYLTNLYGVPVHPQQWDGILRNGLPTGPTGIPWTLPQAGGIVEDYQDFKVLLGQTASYIEQNPIIVRRLPADADGDGVADSRWVNVPAISSSRGKPVFAAIRIIDNCAMLNLNTAFGFYQQPASTDPRHWSEKPWGISSTVWTPYANGANYGKDIGRYLSEVNFSIFLRAYDANRPERIQFARDAQARFRGGLAPTDPYYYAYNSQADDYHNKGVMNIGSSNLPFSFFDISDELEIRNRYLLTGKGSSRFEKRDPQEQTNANASPSVLVPTPANAYQGIAYQTFDFGQGKDVASGIDLWSQYFGVRVAAIPRDASNFGQWKVKMNPLILDDNPYDSTGSDGAKYLYDRRHLCTFYSFDRNIRSGYYLLLESVLQSQPEAIEAVFRPLRHQPIDLRAMTTLTEHDNIVMPDPNDPAYIINAHRNILHLLYTLREREYFALTKSSGPDPNALIKAARKAAQQVANIIDYQDTNTTAQDGPFGLAASGISATSAVYGSQVNANPTYIDKAIIDEMLREVSGGIITPAWPAYNSIDFGLAAGDVVYGYERQPFISEVYTCVNDSGSVISFAVEFHNPYPAAIDVSNWKVVLEAQNAAAGTYLQSYTIPAGQTVGAGGRLVLRSNPAIPSAGTPEESGGFGTQISSAHAIRLLRINPTTGLADLGVDSIRRGQILMLTTDTPDGLDTHHVLKRDDRPSVFCDPNMVDHQSQTQTPGNPVPGGINLTLGSPNGLTLTAKSYPLPVADTSTPFDRFADFQRVAYIGNRGGGTNAKTVTDILAQTSDESEIRFDAQLDWELLNYVCTLSRKEKGIPGRININTAPLHVIAAAIPPQLIMSAGDPNTALTLAQDIIDHRPYTSLTKLLNIQAVKKYVVKAGLDVGAVNIDDDLEERDWIFNRLSNIFTVRSDTFTAYILVRLGTDGPQRRMIAIFDRSNCWTVTDKPQLVALHPVPDPR